MHPLCIISVARVGKLIRFDSLLHAMCEVDLRWRIRIGGFNCCVHFNNNIHAVVGMSLESISQWVLKIRSKFNICKVLVRNSNFRFFSKRIDSNRCGKRIEHTRIDNRTALLCIWLCAIMHLCCSTVGNCRYDRHLRYGSYIDWSLWLLSDGKRRRLQVLPVTASNAAAWNVARRDKLYGAIRGTL